VLVLDSDGFKPTCITVNALTAAAANGGIWKSSAFRKGNSVLQMEKSPYALKAIRSFAL